MSSMSRQTLQIVAALLLACAVGGFILGVRGAPEPARLPGEGGSTAGGAPLAATEATPLLDSVEAPKPAPAPEPEKKEEAKTEADAKTAAIKPAETPAPQPAAPTTPAPAEDRVGDLLDSVTPPPEAPIY